MKNYAIFIITRNAYNLILIDKLEQLKKLNIECYLISDIIPENISDEISEKIESNNLKNNIIHYNDEYMINSYWSKSSIKKSVTSWDKGLYHAYTLKRDFNWFIEDDVYWNNNEIMKELFEIDNTSELITNHCVEEFKTNYHWFLFFETNKLLDDSTKWKATFNPICRLSYKILEKIAEYSNKYNKLFFHEVLFSSICINNNYNILYFTEINIPIKIILEWRNESITIDEINLLKKEYKNILLHPVKIN